jgi:RNA polymerase sigma factor (sigma-70 family)
LNEQQLITQLQAGDEAAFKELVETRQDMVYNTLLGLLQNEADAEDISQEVFIAVYESIGRFKGEAALNTWLYRVAVTKGLEHLRRMKRKKRFAFITALFGPQQELKHDPPDFHHPGVQAEEKERAVQLFKAIARLPEKQRVAFTLQKVEGLNQQQIGAVMETTVSAVESLLHRAKANLRKDLETY